MNPASFNRVLSGYPNWKVMDCAVFQERHQWESTSRLGYLVPTNSILQKKDQIWAK